MLAIAYALGGMSRDEAAKSAGLDRQTLRLGHPLPLVPLPAYSPKLNPG
jgi:hypothetical protein